MYIRRWLNKKGRAFIEVDCGEYGDGGHVAIADCDRRVSLDFSVYEKKDYKTKLAKLDILIESLQQFKLMLTNQQASKK